MSNQSLTGLERSAMGENSQARLEIVQSNKIGAMSAMHRLDNAKEIFTRERRAIGANRSFK